VRLAKTNVNREVVFFAIGFETTAPPHALALLDAARSGCENFSLLVSHVLVPPAIRAILNAPGNRVQGFIAPGHVCAVAGYDQYQRIASEYRVPIVVGGFEPVDLMQAILMLVQQLESGVAGVQNQYSRSVTLAGNSGALAAVEQAFEICDRKWRGIGMIPASGLRLRPEWARYDAEIRFGVAGRTADESPDCLSALVLQGLRKPTDCPAFGGRCTPETPLGAPMVSSEGSCAAYYLYKREEVVQ
jgi:hydrogenase expression/formation protein HypD